MVSQVGACGQGTSLLPIIDQMGLATVRRAQSLVIHPASTTHFRLDDAALDPLYAEAVRLNVPLFIHPGPAGIDGPAGDPALWPGDPFTPRVDHGAVHGRGTCDMKGGLVAALAAVQALRTAGVRLARPLAVHSVMGEEDGGLMGALVEGKPSR